MAISKLILCVDFDGVIHNYASGWKGPAIVADGPVHGAFEWLLKALVVFDVQIYSSRTNQPGGRQAMIDWFAKWAPIEFMGDQQRIDKLLHELWFPTDKPAPFLTIDDRALTFNGNWSDPQFEPTELLKFKPWNKR